MSKEITDLYNTAKFVSEMFPKDMGDDKSPGWGWSIEAQKKVSEFRKAIAAVKPLIEEGK